MQQEKLLKLPIFSVILKPIYPGELEKWRTSLIEMNIRLNNPYSTSGLHGGGMANKIPVLSPRLIWVYANIQHTFEWDYGIITKSCQFN